MADGTNFNLTSSTLAGVITRVKERGFSPGSILSIGAGKGDDAPWLNKCFPGAWHLLLDADSQFLDGWRKLRAADPRICHEIGYAGDTDRIATVTKHGVVGGVVEEDGGAPVQMWRVDTLIANHGLPGPYFLRFDTNGAEVEILRGAEKALANTGLIMMEVYNYKLRFMRFRNLTFAEMVEHMRGLGFGVVDMCDQLHRPLDGALWQFHMFFAPLSDAVFSRCGYRG